MGNLFIPTLRKGSACSTIESIHTEFKNAMDASASNLFGKIRQAVLFRLFDQPDGAWFFRELARQVGASSGAHQLEFAQLVNAGLVSRAADGNRVRFRANTLNPVSDDLQSMVRKTCGLAARTKATLSSEATHIECTAIYGSLAKVGGHAASDIDVLVVGTISVDKAAHLFVPLEENLAREISIRLYEPNDEFQQKRQQGDHFLNVKEFVFRANAALTAAGHWSKCSLNQASCGMKPNLVSALIQRGALR